MARIDPALTFARIVLALSAAPFAVIGVAFTVYPERMGDLVGLSMNGATAVADVRAVYGGLQLGCAVFLALAARNVAWCRVGLAAQLALYGGLASARFVSYFASGLPSSLGICLHAGELAGFALGLVAWHRCSKSFQGGTS